MSLGQPSAPDGPRLLICGEGGTIMSSPDYDAVKDRTIIRPNERAFMSVVDSVHQKDREKFASYESYYNQHCIDSAKAQADVHIVNIVANLRKRIAENQADVFVVFYGTDTMADFVTALGFGVSKKELGEKSIIVTGSMQHTEIRNTDAYRNFQHAASLALMKEVRGKIGLCFNDRFFPPRRFQKVQQTRKNPFASGLRRMAKFDLQYQKWSFDRLPESYDEPRGVEGQPYELVTGVESISLTSTSNYDNLPKMVKGLSGVVLEAPGNGNLRDGPKDLAAIKRTIRATNGLLVVVGKAVQNPDDDDEAQADEDKNEWEDVGYEGDATHMGNIMAGGPMSESEARILLSNWIAIARKNGLKKKAITEFVREQFATYPFRHVDSSKWKGKPREGNGGNSNSHA